MPTYLTPGVYVEEVPAQSKPIEGVGTSMAAFVGLAPGGPVNTPMRISNWTQFARTFGDLRDPENGPFMPGAYLAHAVYGYFQNGGTLCWVVRVGNPDQAPPPQVAMQAAGDPQVEAFRAVALSPADGPVNIVVEEEPRSAEAGDGRRASAADVPDRGHRQGATVRCSKASARRGAAPTSSRRSTPRPS